MPDYRAISEIGHDHDIMIIEDAAEAIGSEYNGKKAGSFGLTGCFSFHGSKTLTTGEGGMLVTDDKAVYDRAQFLRDHGRIPGDVSFRNLEVGYKYKMSSMQAALGLAQLERVNELVERKREIFGWYREELGNIQGIQLNAEPVGVKNSYWMSSVVFDPSLQCPKEKILKVFGEAGIGCRPFFSPLSSLPAYEGTIQARMAAERNKNAYAIGPHGINLPCSMRLTREEAGYVSEILRSVLN
jgi:perosamine synthetase